jgi:hypothetical protein
MILNLAAGAAAGIATARTAPDHPVYKHLIDAIVLTRADAEVEKADWTPKYLNTQQNETLILLAERIVPGSSKARVNRFIDLLLSVDTSENRQNFSNSLLALEEEAAQRFGQVFRALTETQQNEVLRSFSVQNAALQDGKNHPPKGHVQEENGAGLIPRSRRDYFENLKSWVTGAYYSSEVGMRELGWTGEYAFGSFPGCMHPEGHV